MAQAVIGFDGSGQAWQGISSVRSADGEHSQGSLKPSIITERGIVSRVLCEDRGLVGHIRDGFTMQRNRE
ncbi:hypothetical protein MKK75_17610 [Methylobacterium sp. J-030]|uniref:hypothetical protein n=1 Tax=Methylobacterium sp. J-030 TaxID=2836627 RepID=UPI001FB9AB0D|nr:hypothetical protein [Methylobacterium sp. J-030]MCJ2070589.1 hypothetical protein [Methylobacterium sp. J-030]